MGQQELGAERYSLEDLLGQDSKELDGSLQKIKSTLEKRNGQREALLDAQFEAELARQEASSVPTRRLADTHLPSDTVALPDPASSFPLQTVGAVAIGALCFGLLYKLARKRCRRRPSVSDPEELV